MEIVTGVYPEESPEVNDTVYDISGIVSNSYSNVILYVNVSPLHKTPVDIVPDCEFTGAGLVPQINSPLTQAQNPSVIEFDTALALVSLTRFLKGITVSAPSSSWIIYPYSPLLFIPKRKGVESDAIKLENYKQINFFVKIILLTNATTTIYKINKSQNSNFCILIKKDTYTATTNSVGTIESTIPLNRIILASKSNIQGVYLHSYYRDGGYYGFIVYNGSSFAKNTTITFEYWYIEE